jgi:predicted dehydrogenase
MTVEACKAGKDVYVEKPACVYVEEGQKMIEAARKYKRVVQGGTMQRSGYFFKKAVEIVKSGDLGDITFCRTWQAGSTKKEGWGSPQDENVPLGLDWELWLGPAPKRAFNLNRWGIAPKRWSTFRYFWDYAGGAMTDWGVHLLDIVQYAFDEVMPRSVGAIGGKYYVTDNVETPDTMLATFGYPKFVGAYESRTASPIQMYEEGNGTSFHGTKATLVVNRSGYKILFSEKGREPFIDKGADDPQKRQMNGLHWANFLACMKSREKPIAEIETLVRTTWTCLLANVALRSNAQLTWDDQAKTITEDDLRRHLKLKYRSPWKLEV